MSVPQQQLHMLWPENLLDAPLEARLPVGYRLRQFTPEDSADYLALMHGAGFTGWDESTVAAWTLRVLPEGWFLIEHEATRELVATAMVTHNPTELHPFGGELGWVAGSSAHRGQGLGIAVCAAVVRRYLQAGYRRIYLKTDDWRLPALKSYLKMGFEPFLYQWDMPERWEAVCRQLNWPCTPAQWPSIPYVAVQS